MGSPIIRIIKEIDSNKFILKCARCKGTGLGLWSSGHRRGEHSTEPCKVCTGKGVLLIKIKGQLPFVRCARCDGSGRGLFSTGHRRGERSTEPCKACNGAGAQPISGIMSVVK